jgi:hypothetical protein
VRQNERDRRRIDDVAMGWVVVRQSKLRVGKTV